MAGRDVTAYNDERFASAMSRPLSGLDAVRT